MLSKSSPRDDRKKQYSQATPLPISRARSRSRRPAQYSDENTTSSELDHRKPFKEIRVKNSVLAPSTQTSNTPDSIDTGHRHRNSDKYHLEVVNRKITRDVNEVMRELRNVRDTPMTDGS